MMRDFSWNYFVNTGCIHAYMLYTEHKNYLDSEQQETSDDMDEPLEIE
nr:YqzL family protein [Aneurinibacillus terranovensis]